MVLQQALADLNTAYRNFFASRTGARKGTKAGKPRFRSRKDHRQAIRFTANARFKILPNGKLRLPKIGDVAVRWSRPLPGEPSSVTVIRDSAGRYVASFVVETAPRGLLGVEPVVGIDLGLKHFRDVNAAVNVAKAAGLAVTACRAQVRPEAPPLAQRGEAGTHPKSRQEAA